MRKVRFAPENGTSSDRRTCQLIIVVQINPASNRTAAAPSKIITCPPTEATASEADENALAVQKARKPDCDGQGDSMRGKSAGAGAGP